MGRRARTADGFLTMAETVRSDRALRLAAIGLAAGDMALALLVTQLVGVPASIALGHLGARVGPKRVILAGLAVYCLVALVGPTIQSSAGFFGLAVLVGLVQGGVQSLSRSLFARVVPRESAAEMFGFYNMLGKLAAVIGPVLVGATALVTHSPRASIASVAVLFVLGAAILTRVDENRPLARHDDDAAQGTGKQEGA
jgi:UMF1 family MFS transporter